jgi:hypothetical protein
MALYVWEYFQITTDNFQGGNGEILKTLLIQDGQGRNGSHMFLEYETGVPTTQS